VTVEGGNSNMWKIFTWKSTERTIKNMEGTVWVINIYKYIDTTDSYDSYGLLCIRREEEGILL